MTVLALVVALALQGPIVEVEVRGNRLVPDATVTNYLGPLDAFTPPEAFRRLWATGLFEDLGFETETTAGGRRLVVLVREKKLLRSARFVGEALQVDELREALARSGFALLAGTPFGASDAIDVARAAGEILGSDRTVEAELDDASEDQVDLEIRIARVHRPAIVAIALEGNAALSDGELVSVMRLRPTGLFAKLARRDRFDAALLDDDLLRLRELYRRRGYALASVGPATVDSGPEGVSIRIAVSEGSRYRFAAFEVEPGSLLRESGLRSWLPRSGDLFDGNALAEAVRRVERHYQRRGYPSVRVDVEERVASEDPAMIETRVRVDEGDFFRVGRITFTGNRRHRDRDLRALLDLAEAERFDATAAEAGSTALRSLDQFTAVQPLVDLTAGPNRADVTYRLQEVDPFEYLVGGGLNGIEGASGNGQLVAKSVLGRSETMRFDLDLGNRFQNVAASYRDPATLASLGPWARRLVLAADFRRASVTYPDDTSEDTLDVAAGIGGPLGSRLQLAAMQRLVRFDLASTLEGDVAFLTPFLGQRFRTARTDLALTYESRDRTFFPRRGRSLALGYELVALDVAAHRARASGTQLVALGSTGRHSLAFMARAESVWSHGATRDAGLPRFERLFLGSENDLRGFDIRAVGPRANGVVVGGDRLFYGGAEYRFAPAERLRLVSFFDLGNVWATDFDSESLPRLRYDAGAELQVLVPLANLPLRLGYGYNLDRLANERKGRFFVALELRF